jgi:hypothetical protein
MEALNPWWMRVMAAPRKYGDEVRERATRMAVELRQDPATKPGAIARVAGQLGMHAETLRNCPCFYTRSAPISRERSGLVEGGD